MNLKTIQYWHRLEHFYPYKLEEQNNDYIETYTIGSQERFPDFKSPKLKDINRVVRYYSVYLGIFKVDSALRVIDERLKYTPKFKDESDEESCFCNFRLDSEGKFDKKSFRISSFPWAVQRIKENKIYFDNWDEDFQMYQRQVFVKLLDFTEPFNYDFLCEVRDYLANSINWNINYTDTWLRIDMITGDKLNEPASQKEKENQEKEDEEIDEVVKINDLLNSFYVRDLEKVIRSTVENYNYGKALEEFVDHTSKCKINIEKDVQHLFRVFKPSNLPYGRWPSNYNLRAMQQVAVNIFLSKELKQSDVFSVNGPPGTGKTTLLKDIIAEIIVQRAIELSKLNDTEEAFEGESYEVKYGTYINKIRRLKSDISKYGIIVASNNNSAVKNITLELPDIKAIPKQYVNEYAYFKELSDFVVGKETWAMNAAPLGNKKNCSTFFDKFWLLKSNEESEDSKEFNFGAYLRGKRKRSSVNKNTAWKEAVKSFNIAFDGLQAEYVKLENIYETIIQHNKLKKEVEKCKQQLLMLIDKINKNKEECLLIQHDKNGLIINKNELNRLLESYGNKRYMELISKIPIIKNKEKCTKFNETTQKLKNVERTIGELEDKIAFISSQIAISKKEQEKVNEQIEYINKEIQDIKQKLLEFQTRNTTRADDKGNREPSIIPDIEYLSKLVSEKEYEREVAQKTVPWNYEHLNILREKLFLEALKLHQVFTENSNQMYENLDAFNKVIKGMLPQKENIAYTEMLLQSFFIVVPVVSTTFASVGRFLKNVENDRIGYLLIDEAGQAVPQSAIGAIWRSKNVIAVGDPLQIDPVVTLHDKVVEYVKENFEQTELIASKETSVQSLADRTNVYGGFRTISEPNDLWIGSPILVHGRCAKTIFDISNKIAYNGKMIYDTKDNGEEAICKWLNVYGISQNDHFVLEHIKAVENIIIEKFKNYFLEIRRGKNTELPEVFIITPFRSVRAGVSSYYRKNGYLYNVLIENGINVDEKLVRRWISKCVGTVHTFQGKEESTVIICLGADSNGKSEGAIKWACAKPNLLNVAVTRAKRELYIVGDEECWKNKPHFDDTYEIINKNNAASIELGERAK